MTAIYEVIIKRPDNTVILRTNDFIRLAYVRRYNTRGTLTLEIPPVAGIGDFLQDTRIEVWRQAVGGLPMLEGDTCWFLYRVEVAISDSGVYSLVLYAEDAIALLNRRTVAYPADFPDFPIPETTKTAYMDDMMKAIVRENYLAGAGSYATYDIVTLTYTPDPARDMSAYLTVQADAGGAPLETRQFAHQPIMMIFEGLATASAELGVDLIFDIVQTNDTGDPPFLEFRTYTNTRGSDRSVGNAGGNPPVVLSPELGNLRELVLSRDWEQATSRVYVAGNGEGIHRVPHIVSLSNMDLQATPDNPLRYREQFFNMSMVNVVNGPLTSEAESAIYRWQPKEDFSGVLMETPTTVYGRDFFYGDLVTVRLQDRLAQTNVIDRTAHVASVSVRMEDGVEEISATISSTIDLDRNNHRSGTLHLLQKLSIVGRELIIQSTLEKQ